MKDFILIPTYNERENLPILLEELAALPAELHFLVVDDASPDGTGRLAEDLKTRYGERLHCLHRAPPRSFAHSCLEGYHDALKLGAERLLQMDGDRSHPVEAVLPMLKLVESCDLVIGSRYVPGGGVENWPWHRRALSLGANLYARRLLSLPFRDITAGFRCFNRRTLERLESQRFRCDGYGFWVELTLALWDDGCRIREYPIVFRDRLQGRSKMGWPIAWEAARRVLRLRGLRRKGIGEAAKALLGHTPAPEEGTVIPGDE
ncbi:MAG TPA: polyprenol monophosphomannose synthase [bacterium]|nr:polyprenol monophosphomannose synthase [bacterium]